MEMPALFTSVAPANFLIHSKLSPFCSKLLCRFQVADYFRSSSDSSKNIVMKKMVYLLCLIGASFSVSAQAPGAQSAAGRQQQSAGNGRIYGKLVDGAGRGIGSASVLLLQSRFDSVAKKNKEVLLKGISSQANGDFAFEDLPLRGTLTLKISATGFTPSEQKVSFSNPAGARPPAGSDGAKSFTPGNGEKDLGKIQLKNRCANHGGCNGNGQQREA